MGQELICISVIERQKKINEQYPPLPSQILSKDREEQCDDDEDADEDMINNFHKAMYYEALREQAYQAIMCVIPFTRTVVMVTTFTLCAQYQSL